MNISHENPLRGYETVLELPLHARYPVSSKQKHFREVTDILVSLISTLTEDKQKFCRKKVLQIWHL